MPVDSWFYCVTLLFMAKLLYLHGADSNVGSEHLIKDKDARNRMRFIYKLAGGAKNVISFNAPFFANPDESEKRSWFINPKDENEARDPIYLSKAMFQIGESIKCITQEVRERGVKPQDLILCGASQGGFMALYLALHSIITPKQTIAIVPFFPSDMLTNLLNDKNQVKKLMEKLPGQNSPEILWASVENDEFISENMRSTWRKLYSLRIIDYISCSNSKHGVWTNKFKNDIMEWKNRQHIKCV